MDILNFSYRKFLTLPSLKLVANINCYIDNLNQIFIIVLIQLLLCNPLYSQEYFFKKLTVNDGLSQDDVNSIVQDSFGFIWIGTFDGLNRFDGLNVQSFHRETTNDKSLPDNRINALAEDNKKRLWIGTQAGLFAYYSLLDEQFYRVKSPDNIGLITCFVVTFDGNLYATTSNGIYKLKEDTEPIFELVYGTQTLNLESGIQHVNGDLYFVGLSGAFVLKDGRVKEIPNPNNIRFSCLKMTADNRLLAGSVDGLYIIDDEGTHEIKNTDLPGSLDILSISVDHDGNNWIGTETQGLLVFDESFQLIKQIKTSIFQPRGLLSNTILALYLDNSNNLWIGNRNGLCYTSLNTAGINSLKFQNQVRPNVRNMYVDGAQILLGINNQGLFNYDLHTDKLTKIAPQTISYVSEINKIDNTIYVCSNLGLLASTDYGNFEKIPILSDRNEMVEDTRIRCITKDDFSRKFIGTSQGIILWENDKKKLIWQETPLLAPIQGLFVFRMHYDSTNRQLLIGTISKGLHILEMDQDGTFSHLTKGDLVDINTTPVFNTSVWCFHKDKYDVLWIGTDIGLFKRKPNSETFEQISIPGILDKKIMSISESADGKLWLANTHGLICYDSKTERIKKYTREDGLLSSSLTEAIGSYGDTLFFGTTNGVNFIQSSQISTNPNHPDVLISSFKIHNERVKPQKELFGSVVLSRNINATEHLSLNHHQNNFSMEFCGTNYSNSSKNAFRYRLEGFDDKWIYTTSENRTLSYSNLDPDEYSLHLQVANNDGEWPEKGLIIPIKVKPAPWLTPLAYTTYILLSISIFAGFIYFWFNRQRLNHQIQLDKVIINQDHELRERQLRFFADVAHEFKTPLSLILAPFNDMMNSSMSKEKKNMCLQIISRNIQRMSFLVNQLLDFDTITSGEKLPKVVKRDLAESIRNYSKAFTWQVQNEGIDLRLNLDQCIGYFDPDILEKGLYNVLSNAVKHTPKGGVIEISLKVVLSNEIEFAIITTSDSGSGIPDEQKEHVFERFYHGKDRASSGIGLHMTQRLIQAHGGTITVEDSNHGGTQFTISLPISKSNYPNVEEDETEIREPIYYSIDEELMEPESTDNEETILIVEDDHDLRNYLKLNLQNDYSILESNNGKQGLDMAQQNLPDIIISDVMMPVMDGIEMCSAIKTNKDTSHIPILFLTAKGDIEYQKKGLEAGAWDYIVKPFNSDALRQKVANILETRNRFKSYLLDHNINLDIKTHYTSYDQKLLMRINEVIEENLGNPNFNVNALASEVGLSRMHLHRKLKTLTGETAKNIIIRVKIKYAVSMFDQGCDRIQEVMHEIGMINYANFNNNFKKVMEMTATEYLNRLKEKTN